MNETDEKDRNLKIGLALKSCREYAKITQQELADKTGVSKNYISALERGLHKMTVNNLLDFCIALDVTPNELLGYRIDNDTHAELISLINGLSKENYEKAVTIIKLLQ